MTESRDAATYTQSDYQRDLWNKQHADRGRKFGPEDWLKYTPNQSAADFHCLLPENALVLEVGSGNGRDARFWALQGHSVVCMDFSEVALGQLTALADEQGLRDQIFPVVYDISSGKLPLRNEPMFDGFYARSSLHISDDAMTNLAGEIDSVLKPGGHVLIVGKSGEDEKINRSEVLSNGLAIDHNEDGHLRRAWSEEYIREMCEEADWDLVRISNSIETTNKTTSSFITVIAKKHE